MDVSKPPHAILVVATAGDPGGFVAHGACGSKPPWVVLGVWQAGVLPSALPRHERGVGLPLWWDGKPVPAGLNLAVGAGVPHTWPAPAPWEWTTEKAVWLAELLVNIGHAERVVLLDLMDGKLAERIWSPS